MITYRYPTSKVWKRNTISNNLGSWLYNLSKMIKVKIPIKINTSKISTYFFPLQ